MEGNKLMKNHKFLQDCHCHDCCLVREQEAEEQKAKSKEWIQAWEEYTGIKLKDCPYRVVNAVESQSLYCELSEVENRADATLENEKEVRIFERIICSEVVIFMIIFGALILGIYI